LLAARELRDRTAAAFRAESMLAFEAIAAARPTAVNLRWAVEQCAAVVLGEEDIERCLARLERLALDLHADDARRCADIGRHGAELVPQGAGIITHCNTGALATGGEGTALSVILAAHRQGKDVHVYVDETRPLLQGARLTMWELQRHDVPCTLISDSMAASLMRAGRVQLAVTGADRIAANGDSANKIGTYPLAIAAAYHEVPFYIAAPISTIDFSIATGDAIPIEQRDEAEVTQLQGLRIAPEGARAFNPSFDVTPAALIASIVTERGIIAPPYGATLAALRT
jgi:methylthioribose-1-phosphate isomerase